MFKKFTAVVLAALAIIAIAAALLVALFGGLSRVKNVQQRKIKHEFAYEGE